MTDLLNEITFCDECPYSGEPNGCNRKEGICKAYESYFDLVEENVALHERLENAVGLPCKVGDTVWFFDSGRILKEGKISMLQCKSDGNWKMRITHNLTYSQCKSVFDDYCSKLGIEYFTDRATAEARLAELKKED